MFEANIQGMIIKRNNDEPILIIRFLPHRSVRTPQIKLDIPTNNKYMETLKFTYVSVVFKSIAIV